jgi:hypothetical protein
MTSPVLHDRKIVRMARQRVPDESHVVNCSAVLDPTCYDQLLGVGTEKAGLNTPIKGVSNGTGI